MTTSADLIAAFADRISLPIDLDEVKDWLLAGSFQDEINFIPVELDTGVIRGFLKRFRRHRGGWDMDPLDVSDIYYDRRQDPDWINIVCAKELLHILDAARCSTREEFNKLTAGLALPDEVKHLLDLPDFAFVDKMGDLPASALMLPAAARAHLLPAYEAKILTDETIAELAMIPPQHVRAVMSPHWPALYDVIMASVTPPDEADDADTQMEMGFAGAFDVNSQEAPESRTIPEPATDTKPKA